VQGGEPSGYHAGSGGGFEEVAEERWRRDWWSGD
jgi:hypothetical protein